MQGYWDIGKELKCGCSPQNYCLCDAREAAAASSYINKCVATQCTLPNEVSVVLDLYNGYCATANVEVAGSTTKPYSFTGVTTGGGNKTPGAAVGSDVTSGNNAAKETSGSGDRVNTVNQSGSTNSPALGLGAIIGIAVGGVVLISALLCAGCCLIWRHRSNKRKAVATGAGDQGFKPTTPEAAYIAPANGAAQLDGRPGAVKAEEKPLGSVGESTKVSPLNTPQPTPQPAAAAVHNPVSPVVGAHEIQGNVGKPSNAHEMYGGQQQQYLNVHEVQGNGGFGTNAHEMQAGNGGYWQHGQYHEIYTHSPRPAGASL